MEPTIRPLSNEEKNMMEFHRDIAAKICKKYAPEFDGTFNSKMLSTVFSNWLQSREEFVKENYDMDFYAEKERKVSAYMIKMCLGTVFGDILNKEFQSEWKHVTDQYGEEISIYHSGSKYATFPYSSIQKRFESKELNFFQAIEDTMRWNVQKK